MVNILSCLALLPAAGFCYQHFAAQRDEKNYPPAGELIDIGGFKLHLHCQGEERPGIPTVIVETGIWDCSQSWQLVQSSIASMTRICTYDRAGYGWSDVSPHPRTFEQMVIELKVLLEKKGIRPPFIFIGHSLGGPIARFYQSQYPEDVAGMIFVDALHKEEPLFPRVFKVVSRAFSLLSHFGVLRLFRFCPSFSTNPQWTSPMQKTYTACHMMKIKAFATCLKEWEGYETSFRELKAKARSLATIPVTLVFRDSQQPIRPWMSKEALEKDREELEKLQKQHLKDSPHARVIIAEKSGHLVQIDRPDIVIDEIRRMIKPKDMTP